jgi:hypothetical protein
MLIALLDLHIIACFLKASSYSHSVSDRWLNRLEYFNNVPRNSRNERTLNHTYCESYVEEQFRTRCMC